MRILVCNDDGIDAPGLGVLAQAARTLASEVFVVAPARKWTAASHQLSFDRDLTLARRDVREYVCSGAPADCVIAAMTLLFADGNKPDLVLAGVNDKLNVAEDIAYSGTMAIAREATFWDVPAIGFSRDASVAADPGVAAIGRIAGLLWERRQDWRADGCWLSVNLPPVLPAALAEAHLGHDKLGSASAIVARSADVTTFRLVRGRPESSSPGDERAIVASGRVSVLRHGWRNGTLVGAPALDAWNRALR